jgi:LPS-assembly protein
MDNRFYKPACPGAQPMQPKRSPMFSDRHPSRPLLHAPRRPGALCRACCLALLAACCAGAAQAQAEPGIELRLTPRLEAAPSGSAAHERPVYVRADEIRGRPDLDVEAIGNAELRRADVRVRADRLSYDIAADLARAQGNVRVLHAGNVFSGPEAQVRLDSFEGFVLEPTFLIGLTGATGSAQRLDFIDRDRAVATMARYTSCTVEGDGDPAWLLSADSVKLDLEANQGVAEGAVLRFLGVPILAAPKVSFPLTDARKTGWLPPLVALDSSSGFVTAVPWYWNIAPNRDATITPIVRTRRGPGVDGEFRYLEPAFEGSANLNLLPWDRDFESGRWGAKWAHEGRLGPDWSLQLRTLRVSDNDYWKDFPDAMPTLTRRLLTTEGDVRRSFAGLTAGSDWTVVAGVQAWQALQGTDPSDLMEVPYQRLPQIGVRTDQALGAGFEGGLEAEFNYFNNPDGVVDTERLTGMRLHAIGTLARPYRTPGWALTPRLSFNAASYALDQAMSDGRMNGSRIIPTASLDSVWVLERDANSLFDGRAIRQTLEPRVMYVYTPFVEQSMYPLFDTAPKDFNFESIFTENAFSGVDRVSDGNQLTAGLTTRLIDPASGAEALRLAVVQRVRFADQRVTPEGDTASRRLSDVLIAGSTTLIPRWTLAGSAQYDPDQRELARLLVGARYSPGPFRTVNVGYRQTRNPAPDPLSAQRSEQVEMGWQWPLFGPTPLEFDGSRPALRASTGGSGSCQGSLYTVGRINYSLKESRVTDGVLGFEYDSGCWIARVVFERVSTGVSEATTRLMLQLELVGLSRLGANPLQVLKDNIPGYRMLRDTKSAPAPLLPSYD